MSKTIPFDVSEHCDVCGIKGAFDYCGEYLCERCSRAEFDPTVEYEEDKDDELYCGCTDCKCGKVEED